MTSEGFKFLKSCGQSKATTFRLCRELVPESLPNSSYELILEKIKGSRGSLLLTVNALTELLYAVLVFKRAGINFNLVAGAAEEWNGQFEAGCNFGWLHHLAGGITLNGWLGVGDLAYY